MENQVHHKKLHLNQTEASNEEDLNNFAEKVSPK